VEGAERERMRGNGRTGKRRRGDRIAGQRRGGR